MGASAHMCAHGLWSLGVRALLMPGTGGSGHKEGMTRLWGHLCALCRDEHCVCREEPCRSPSVPVPRAPGRHPGGGVGRRPPSEVIKGMMGWDPTRPPNSPASPSHLASVFSSVNQNPVTLVLRHGGTLCISGVLGCRGPKAGQGAGGRGEERRGVGAAGVTTELSKNRLSVCALTSRNRQLPLTNPFIKATFTLFSVTIVCLNRGLWSLLATSLPITEWLCSAPKHRGLHTPRFPMCSCLRSLAQRLSAAPRCPRPALLQV